MSEFIADLREPRVPTVYEDFGDDDFVAELRPPRLSYKTGHHSMEMEEPHCQENPGFPSDEHVQGLLTSGRFSPDQITELIHGSTLTLIKKLLYGRNIVHIQGQIRISLDDKTQPPVLINFDHPVEESVVNPNSKERSPFADVTDEFNVRVRRNDQKYPTKNFLNNTLKVVDQRYLNPRRGSDADSGYGGKSSDEAESGLGVGDRMDMETSRIVRSDERSCSSVDTICTVLGSELRYQREPSCEKARMASVSPSPESWEELDEECSALVIDENYDPEANSEPTSTAYEKDISHEGDEDEVVIGMNSDSGAAHAVNQQRNQETVYPDSQLRSPSLPVDLSGDSEDPRGRLTPLAQNLVLCNDVSPQGLVCRLCHAVTSNATELTNHAAQTHKLHVCVHCFQSFTAKADLENHAHIHSPTECVEEQAPDIDGHDQQGEQVLDLSIKKVPVEFKNDRLGEVESSDITGLHRALSGQSGQDVSRDGYRQPGPDSSFTTITPRSEPTREILRLQSFDGMENGLVSIKIEPDCGAQPTLHQHFAFSEGPHGQLVRCKTEEPVDALKLEHSPRAVNFAHIKVPQKLLPLHGKPSIRFSPYSRERLAELTAKFIASRKETPSIPIKKGPVPAGCSKGDATLKAAIHKKIQSSTYAEGMAKVNGEISCEVSMSETALKNRVNAFVKSGGHQAQVEALAKTTVSGCNNVKPSDARDRSNHGTRRKASNGSFICGHEGCGEEFASFQALERHSVDSHGRYLCEHCSKTFTARPNRDRHVRYHTGERPYKCDLCPMAFFRGDDLKYHRTTRHPSAEPFVCKRCNRSFTWNRDLERHQRHCRCKA
ncbi:hypothetical protein RRG08_040626 [Elysia crispata]|uniref:C2H2-type domain-containing protein n=1 Tax=Elysia crispata TaxID=231223 RepID=A0AAE1E9U3_9GAST|nr:hypothetical protein RRG08_040626 [Elysia crispata]